MTERALPGPVLRYRTPAQRWTDALPIGNGRLGAMIYGGPNQDRWQINDDTCWSGWPGTTAGSPASEESSPEVIGRVREALFAGDVATAEREVRKVQYGRSQAYQPLGEVTVTAAGSALTLLERRLDLTSAVVSWEASADGLTDSGGTGETSRAEVFVSAPAGAIVGRYSWPEPINVRITVTAAHAEYGRSEVRTAGAELIMTSRMPSLVYPSHDRVDDPVHYDDTPGHAITAVMIMNVDTDGTVEDDDGALMITGATELRLTLVTETDFVDPFTAPHGDLSSLLDRARVRIAEVAARPYDELLAEHVAEHRSWFDRFELELDDGSPVEPDTDVLLARSLAGDVAPQLAALLVAYGRYLMIASSRPGSRAINLQGIWNPMIQPPWSSNYTVNINTEMNYWPALPGNLIECAEPLYELVETMAVTGRDTARRVFDRPGWAAHHNADIWGYTLPVGDGTAKPCWAAWPMAGFWLLRHFWEHYEYTGDLRFWAERAWPLLDGAVEFGLASLVELPGGELGTAPSTSPENQYLDDAGQPTAVTISATMDIALLRDVFRMWLDAAQTVREAGTAVDAHREAAVTDALKRLPRPEPTPRGTYPEWRADLTEAEPKHRHQSHLYDLYPGDAVSAYDPADVDRTAAMAETLRLRGPHSTGWSLAWRIALHARLRDTEAATQSLDLFLAPVPEESDPRWVPGTHQGGVYRNLFCAHPPFQIDGNFGAFAGVIEMLVQSHGRLGDRRVIELLPCLPAGWPNGRLTGVRARGGLTLDLTWSDSRVTAPDVRADPGLGQPQRLVLRMPYAEDRPIDLAPGAHWTLEHLRS